MPIRHYGAAAGRQLEIQGDVRARNCKSRGEKPAFGLVIRSDVFTWVPWAPWDL